MKRYFIDCRDHPSDVKCTVAFFADTRDEILDIVVRHRQEVHRDQDSPGFREKIGKDIKEAPPLLRCHRF